MQQENELPYKLNAAPDVIGCNDRRRSLYRFISCC